MTELRVYCRNGVYTQDTSISNKVKSIIVDESCKKLGTYSLGLTFLENVTLPNTLIEIEDDAFHSTKISKIFIPKSVTILHPNNPFNYMPYLERIDVDQKNLNFASNNGILFSKNFDHLIHYPMQIKSPIYKAPPTVRYINPYAFHAHAYIETIVFHDKILEMREGSFWKTQKLKRIMIPYNFSQPKLLKDAFLESSFIFPDNVMFYAYIKETCIFIRDSISYRFEISLIFLIIS